MSLVILTWEVPKAVSMLVRTRPARRPMIAMTTSISMSVKALRFEDFGRGIADKGLGQRGGIVETSRDGRRFLEKATPWATNARFTGKVRPRTAPSVRIFRRAPPAEAFLSFRQGSCARAP